MVEQSLRVEAREHVGGGKHIELRLSQQRELEEAAQRDERSVERSTSSVHLGAGLAPVGRFHPPPALMVAATGYYRGQAVQYRACVYRRADRDLWYRSVRL